MNLSHIFLLILFFLTLLHFQSRVEMRARLLNDWVLDGVSLFCYFILLPIVQIAIGYKIYALIIPAYKGTLDISWGTAILIHLFVDYVWYWNHRLFHAQTPLWNLHAVHHETKNLDIFASQRNSIWSFVFMIYFWSSPLILFLAKNPTPFLTTAAFAVLINFWGHTRLNLPRNSKIRKILSLAIIQPEDHFWHHSGENTYCNFATLLNFWDKIHGTWHQPNTEPKTLGFELNAPTWRKIIFPKF